MDPKAGKKPGGKRRKVRSRSKVSTFAARGGNPVRRGKRRKRKRRGKAKQAASAEVRDTLTPSLLESYIGGFGGGICRRRTGAVMM